MGVRPFKSIDEQIAILESRGVSFLDRDGARRLLEAHGYYSVVNGCKHAFLDTDRTNQSVEVYRDGTDFLHFEILYQFDRALRRRALAALLDAEGTLSTASVYSFCEKHGGKYDYLDPGCYCSSKDYRSKKDYSTNLIKVLSALQAASSNRQRKAYVEHYLRKHGHVPLWVAAKCLTFGVMSNFYELQQPDVKQRVCEIVSQSSGAPIAPRKLRTAYKTLSGFRNICAHEERLYCARLGRNGEVTFRNLVEAIALVSDPINVSEFCESVLYGIDLLSSESMPPEILGEVLDAMSIDRDYIESFVKNGEDRRKGAVQPDPGREEELRKAV